jgi:transposase-like protein
MEDYPRTLMELEARFATEEACREYLAQLRWPNGFACTRCDGAEAWDTSRGLRVCTACGHQASVTAGTIFHGTRVPLVVWFRAIWWVTSQKNGASALGLQRVLGLGSYRTAWTWLHKLRRAMVRPGREQLCGEVEVDETFLGGLEPGGGRRHVGKKSLVAVAAEVRGRAIGRIRLRRVRDSSANSLLPFVREVVAPGSVVVTDGLATYRGLPKLGYRHERRVVLGSGEGAEALLPRVHRVASLLKRWLMGTHHGAVSGRHLEYYLDEFTFRFNRRSSHHRGKLFYRLLQQAMAVEPAPYAAIVGGSRPR